jgi:hypothetical protein
MKARIICSEKHHASPLKTSLKGLSVDAKPFTSGIVHLKAGAIPRYRKTILTMDRKL